MGIRIGRNNISHILKNPFYCGIISNRLLEGKIVQGKHEKIISQEIFLAVNELLSSSRNPNSSYCINNERLPLKQILFCHKCKSKMTGYIVRKKDIPYYKCRTTGCSCNKNAGQLGLQFMEILRTVMIDEKNYPSLKKEFSLNFIELEKMTCNSLIIHKGYRTRVKNKIELVEERYSLGLIKESLYNKQLAKFQKETEEIENEMEKIKAGLVPKRDIKKEAERIMGNLSGIWTSGNLRTKRLIQTLIFPEGIFYDKATDKIFVKVMAPGFYLTKN